MVSIMYIWATEMGSAPTTHGGETDIVGKWMRRMKGKKY